MLHFSDAHARAHARTHTPADQHHLILELSYSVQLYLREEHLSENYKNMSDFIYSLARVQTGTVAFLFTNHITYSVTTNRDRLSRAAASPERPPLQSGRLSRAAASPERPPLQSGRLSRATASPERPPLQSDRLSRATASPERPPLQSDRLSRATASPERPPLQSDRLESPATK